MGELYRFLSHLIGGYTMVLFYLKILQAKKLQWQQFVCVFVYATYMALAHNLLLEPFRSIVGLAILAFGLTYQKEKFTSVALLLPFLIFPLIRVVLAIVVGISTYRLFSQSVGLEFVQLFILLPVEILTITIIHKQVKTINLLVAVSEKEIKVIIYLSTALVWLIFGVLHILGNFNNDTLNGVVATLMVFLVLTSTVVIFLILYAVKKHYEKSKLKVEILLATQEKAKLQSKMKLINDERLSLRKINHKYNEHLPVLATMTCNLATKINNEASDGILSSVENLKKIAFNLSHELILDDVDATVALLDFPKEWEYLKTMLAGFMTFANQNGIVLNVKAQVNDWRKFEVWQFGITGLIKNLVSNAIKETVKSSLDVNLIEVYFLENEFGIFSIEITDYAHEFPIEILQNLGISGNSTNGTGYGYTEIFKILELARASLIINERQSASCLSKVIAVIFDGLGKKYINSTYRSEKLVLVG